MDILLEINGFINKIVWGWPMIILLLSTSIFLTFRLNLIQVTKFVYIMRNTLVSIFKKSEGVGQGEVSAFQAVATALAATVGTGNIAGVALAIAVGGPGAVFWLWLSAFFGMATKYAEVVLAVTYREVREDGSYNGGPMYYIKKGLGLPWLATIFAVFGALASFGIGNMTQANSVADALRSTFNISPVITGVVLAVLTGIVILGGIKRIGAVTEKLVPFMALFYIISSLIIIGIERANIPLAFQLIFESAFTGRAASGGFLGATLLLTMRYGIARGIFTNEAGLGSAPIAHAAATTDHPVRQGIWGVFEVFMDTIVICTMTALVILVSGLWDSGLEGAALTTAAFETGFKGGGIIVSIGLSLFAFSTVLGWAYYGERCCDFLFGPKGVKIYRFIFVPMVFVGAIGGLKTIWDISDTLNGLMAIPNLIGLLFLSGVVVIMTKDFFKDPNRIRQSSSEYLDLLPEKYRNH